MKLFSRTIVLNVLLLSCSMKGMEEAPYRDVMKEQHDMNQYSSGCNWWSACKKIGAGAMAAAVACAGVYGGMSGTNQEVCFPADRENCSLTQALIESGFYQGGFNVCTGEADNLGVLGPVKSKCCTDSQNASIERYVAYRKCDRQSKALHNRRVTHESNEPVREDLLEKFCALDDSIGEQSFYEFWQKCEWALRPVWTLRPEEALEIRELPHDREPLPLCINRKSVHGRGGKQTHTF